MYNILIVNTSRTVNENNYKRGQNALLSIEQ
jgi:hypothetical protein